MQIRLMGDDETAVRAAAAVLAEHVPGFGVTGEAPLRRAPGLRIYGAIVLELERPNDERPWRRARKIP
ncbi:hypothetical protein [Rhodovastum atsumiense]|uniref:Uncharacterized protein n=1 Tax=Rhodovastum atsumiense TaxID=504468 RepID=A0A5M6ITJ8_9PROT|nr:hypothetical protein [Rhodovastum atsumiense]KAA5611640.1 hypothetical protein F1189_13855 [Rhodovastum atsumiense]